VLGQASNLHPCRDLTTPDNTCDFVENILGKHPGRDYKQFGPRVGFVWDPLKHGRTVITRGYGIYYDRVVTEVPLLEALLMDEYCLCRPSLARRAMTFSQRVRQIARPRLCRVHSSLSLMPTPRLLQPHSPAEQLCLALASITLRNNAKHPYTQQFTVGLQHQIAENWIVSAAGSTILDND